VLAATARVPALCGRAERHVLWVGEPHRLSLNRPPYANSTPSRPQARARRVAARIQLPLGISLSHYESVTAVRLRGFETIPAITASIARHLVAVHSIHRSRQLATHCELTG
jgi:hypothetical protein